ncbi:MAG: hypothetical protein H6738_14480 [Alphaproteobacteria bacterium]|nr:hypothetical protein [Alphaproteobacteria bacterium]MCB9697981.1 hypothetical protein [Alphaproteobacteria bacterium]
MLISLLLACATGPGTIGSPLGAVELRTASYRIATTDAGTEAVILLSNGDLPCELPVDEVEVQRVGTAACREGARHLVLRAYAEDGVYVGEFGGRSHLRVDETTAEEPRLVGASWYAVIEAALVDLDGLGRAYMATDDELLADFGSGGELSLVEEDGALVGSFSFPVEDLTGTFEATACEGGSSLLDLLALYPVALCL